MNVACVFTGRKEILLKIQTDIAVNMIWILMRMIIAAILNLEKKTIHRPIISTYSISIKGAKQLAPFSYLSSSLQSSIAKMIIDAKATPTRNDTTIQAILTLLYKVSNNLTHFIILVENFSKLEISSNLLSNA